MSTKTFVIDCSASAGASAPRVIAKALRLGLGVKVEISDSIAGMFRQSGHSRPGWGDFNAPNDPSTTAKLINAGAVIRMPAKDNNADGMIDAAGGGKASDNRSLHHARRIDARNLRAPVRPCESTGERFGEKRRGLAERHRKMAEPSSGEKEK